MGWAELQSQEVFISPGIAESKRFGMEILNIQCGLHSQGKLEVLSEALAALPFDLAIVRYPSGLRDFSVWLADSRFKIIYSDPTVYWGISVRQEFPKEIPDYVTIKEAQVDDLQRVVSVLASSFSGYQSHWHFNPRTKHLDMVDAYTEWVANKIIQTNSTCYLLFVESEAAGFALVERIDETSDILLAGISEKFQSMGFYKHLLTRIESDAAKQDVQKLVISTQSQNVNVQKSWSRYGLEPLMTIHSVHVEKRS